MNTPIERRLEVLDESGRVVWTADLEESSSTLDRDAHMYSRAVPAFHAFSQEGDASGKLVYANYGRPEDFQELLTRGIQSHLPMVTLAIPNSHHELQGIQTNGTIAIVRSGALFRGLKVETPFAVCLS